MSWVSVETGLLKSVGELNLGVQVVKEGATAEQSELAQQGDVWIELHNLPANTESLDKTTTNQLNGIYQIDVYGQINMGKLPLLQLVDAIVPRYSLSKEITEGGVTVQFAGATPSNMRPDGAYNVINITIVWFAYVPK